VRYLLKELGWVEGVGHYFWKTYLLKELGWVEGVGHYFWKTLEKLE